MSELQRLDKAKGEALIMHARQYPIITEIADISSYDAFSGYPTVPFEPFALPEVSVFSVQKLYLDIRCKRRKYPFGRPGADDEEETKPETVWSNPFDF